MTKTATSKSSEVRALLASGMSTADIAKKVGCTLGLVYNVKSRMASGPRRKPGRPRRASAAGTIRLDGFIESIRQSDEERKRLRAALERVAQVLAGVL